MMKKIIFLAAFLIAPILYGQADCNDSNACNFNASATSATECLYTGDPCDDSNPSTINDAIDNKCECLGVLNLPADFSIQDPCNCANPEHIDTDGDGQIDLFYETVVITAATGQTWTLGSPNGVLDMNGNPLTSLTANETDPSTYVANFYHAAGTGYSSVWSNGMSTLVIFNSCDACAAIAAVPTMSQWGLIILAMFSFTFLLLFVMAGQTQLMTTTGQTVSAIDWKKLNSYPFDASLFQIASKITVGVLLAISLFAIMVYGFFTLPDVIGLTLASPIFTYLVHLILMSKNKK